MNENTSKICITYHDEYLSIILRSPFFLENSVKQRNGRCFCLRRGCKTHASIFDVSYDPCVTRR